MTEPRPPPPPVLVRPIERNDCRAWLALWESYNAFYGRKGALALPAPITQSTWARFFDAAEPVHALVAESGGEVVGLAHFLYHRSTSRIEPTCYLQDLFVAEAARGRGAGRALVEAVYAAALKAGVLRVYWQTQADNAVARRLYDQVARHAGFIVYAHDA